MKRGERSMSVAKVLFVCVVLALAGLWVLAWTPLYDSLPLVLKQFTYAFGGILTFAVPVLIVIAACLVFKP